MGKGGIDNHKSRGKGENSEIYPLTIVGRASYSGNCVGSRSDSRSRAGARSYSGRALRRRGPVLLHGIDRSRAGVDRRTVLAQPGPSVPDLGGRRDRLHRAH